MECLGENTVVDLVDALVLPDRRIEIDAHVARCDSCRRLVSALAKKSSTPSSARRTEPIAARSFTPGTMIGRYIVGEPLGAGAMGSVVAATDPLLERKVALKLLHPALAQRDRIDDEARAMARLSHPSVIAVHDVGTFEDHLFLAMELVEGGSLRQWLAGRPRDPVSVLGVFRQLASGLAAAHHAGLVHRDVKPDNVMIASDGRARLVDFGLAAGPNSSTELVGTPAYMAPELFETGVADHTSDQFAFCVSLFEALHGVRPFVINTFDEIDAHPPRVRAAVSPAVAAAIVRGLSAQPEARFPSMTAWLEAVERDSRRSRRRVWLGVGVVGAVALAATVGARWSSSPPPVCRDAAATLATAWSPVRGELIRARFATTGLPYAAESAREVIRGLDRFSGRWIDARTDACVATRVRGEQSDQVLTLRMMCLDAALAEVDALVTGFAEADAHVVSRAATAIDGLPDLGACANLAALLARVPPPANADASKLKALDALLAQGRALRDASRWNEAIVVATKAVDHARGIAHPPTLGAALYLLGETKEGAGASQDAERLLREAYASAEIGRDDLLAARTAVELVFVVGQQQARFAEATEWAFHAETAIERAGGDAELEAWLAGQRGTVLYGQGDFVKSRAQYQIAFDWRVKMFGADARATAESLFNLGRAVMAGGDVDGGLDMMQRAAATIERSLGPMHPKTAYSLDGVGAAQLNAGRFKDGLATLERARKITLATLAPDYPDVARILLNEGNALQSLGRPTEALVAALHAFAIVDRPGVDPFLKVTALSQMGEAERALERFPAALQSFRNARDVVISSIGPNHELAAQMDEQIGDVQIDQASYAAALDSYRRALALRDRVNEPEYFEKAFALAGIGKAAWKLGHAIDGVAPLRRAVTLIAGYGGDAMWLAQMRLLLAEVLWDAGGSHAEAWQLADAAEQAMIPSESSRDHLVELRAWQARHPRPR